MGYTEDRTAGENFHKFIQGWLLAASFARHSTLPPPYKWSLIQHSCSRHGDALMHVKHYIQSNSQISQVLVHGILKHQNFMVHLANRQLVLHNLNLELFTIDISKLPAHVAHLSPDEAIRSGLQCDASSMTWVSESVITILTIISGVQWHMRTITHFNLEALAQKKHQMSFKWQILKKNYSIDFFRNTKFSKSQNNWRNSYSCRNCSTPFSFYAIENKFHRTLKLKSMKENGVWDHSHRLHRGDGDTCTLVKKAGTMWFATPLLFRTAKYSG